MAITFQAAGTAVSGTGTLTPTWPTHQSADIGILLIETYDAYATLDTASDFTLIGYAGTALETFVTAYWCRAVNSSQAAPVVSDMGDHGYAVILTLRGCISTGSPVDTYATLANIVNASSYNLPGVTTTVDNAFVMPMISWGYDSSTNGGFGVTCADLASVTTLHNAGTTSGNGGGLGIAGGIKASAGAISSTSISCTVSAGLLPTSPMARMTIVFKPETGSGATVLAPAGTMALTGYAPSVVNSGPGQVYPTAGTMALTGYAPSFGTSGITSVPAGTLTLTGYPPTVEGEVWEQQDDDTQTWTEI